MTWRNGRLRARRVDGESSRRLAVVARVPAALARLHHAPRRGHGSYPYPFLHSANGGYGTVLIHVLAILVGMLAFVYATVRIGNLMSASRAPHAAAAVS
jgi:hypothetical protein